MNEAEYRELLRGNKLECHILPLVEVLEQYVNKPMDISLGSLDKISNQLSNEDIKIHLSEIRKEAKGNQASVLRTYLDSLKSNISGFVAMSHRELSERRGKLAKLICSYINITRYLLEYETLEDILRRGTRGGEKLVLALGLVKVEADNIRVTSEIDRIVDLSKGDEEYYVIPIYGCSTDVFFSINEKANANIVHVAGHGETHKNGKRVIQFVDATMTYPKLCEKLGSDKELLILNCCNTYEYVNRMPVPVSDYAIVHEGEVLSDVAFEFSNEFYRTLLQTHHLDKAWKSIQTIETPLQYHLLLR